MQTIFGMGLFQTPSPLIHCEIGIDQRQRSYYKWVWLQVNFEGAIFAGRKKSMKTSKFKCLKNKALYTVSSDAALKQMLHADRCRC